MARPENKNVDYFPCYCRDGKVLYILESRWGNNGWAFFYKLWKMLGDADHHYIDLRPLDNWEFLRAKMGVSDAETTAILDKLSEMRVIDPELWAQRVVWSDSFVESVADVWKRRKQLIPQKPMFLIQKPGLSGTETPGDTRNDGVSASESTQRKGKERKVKNINILCPNFDSDGPEITLSTLLLDLIKNRNPNHRKPNLKTWAVHIRRLIDLDKRSPEEIRAVIEFSQRDSFWQNNILSTEKLRQKFDQLWLKMNGGGNNGNRKNHSGGPGEAFGKAKGDGTPYPVEEF